MTIKTAAASTGKTLTQALAAMTDVTPDQNKIYRFDGTEEWMVHNTLPGHTTVDGDRSVAFVPGQLYTLQEINRYFPAATITSITPATGAAAGGTAVVIRGTNFTGATAAGVEGTAMTSFSVIDDTEIHATTAAKSAGTYDVTVTDDSGTATLVDGFIYT